MRGARHRAFSVNQHCYSDRLPYFFSPVTSLSIAPNTLRTIASASFTNFSSPLAKRSSSALPPMRSTDSPRSVICTRRFCVRPSSVVFSATG